MYRKLANWCFGKEWIYAGHLSSFIHCFYHKRLTKVKYFFQENWHIYTSWYIFVFILPSIESIIRVGQWTFLCVLSCEKEIGFVTFFCGSLITFIETCWVIVCARDSLIIASSKTSLQCFQLQFYFSNFPLWRKSNSCSKQASL